MLSFLRKLFIGGNEKKEDWRVKMEESMDKFQNRPIYKELTTAIIDNTPDGELLQTIFDNLCEKMPEDYEKEFEIVMSWNISRQAIYMIWLLEAEVNNGGFNQFYVNFSGQFYEFLPNALRLVGANQTAELTQRANDTFEAENDKITQHMDGTIEGFSKSYEDNPLNKFDDEFYNMEENLTQLQVDYIRAHKADFTDH